MKLFTSYATRNNRIAYFSEQPDTVLTTIILQQNDEELLIANRAYNGLSNPEVVFELDNMWTKVVLQSFALLLSFALYVKLLYLCIHV